jgi:adenylate kinase family enzyme
MMRKMVVFGLPGTGKTTLALRLAGLLGVPHHDLDHVLFTASGLLPLAEFRARTAALAESPGWVIDGNYSKLADVTWHRADTVIWLDYPLPLIVSRVTRRNLRRLAGREPAPGGAFGWRRAFFSRKSVLANAVRKYLRNRGKYAAQLAETRALGVQVLRFRTSGQAEQWLGILAAAQPHSQRPGTGASGAGKRLADRQPLLSVTRWVPGPPLRPLDRYPGAAEGGLCER